jgi:hypothetical protein
VIGGIAFWFGLAKAILPIVLRWIADAQRAGLMNEGEKRLLAKQLVAYAEELGLWNDIQNEVSNMSDTDLRDLLTGRLSERGETEHSKPK